MIQVSNKLSNILPHVKIVGNTIYSSTILNKRGFPLVRIDSIKPVKAIMLKVNIDSIEICSIINNTNTGGFFSEIYPIINHKTILINNDSNIEFWDYIINRYKGVKRN